MKKNKDVHLVYKKVGETPYQAILQYKKENLKFNDFKMTYAGRLDPMAEGLLLVLSGEKVYNKEEYLNLPKTYEFEMLWGFETDTADLLGLQVESRKLKVKSRVPEEREIKEYLEKSVGKFNQLYPIYSSRPVGGKPLFEWAREGKINEVDIPKHEVEIYKIKFIKRREVNKKDILKEILKKISLVNGDFRQKEILTSWQAIMSKVPFDILTVDRIKIEVSSGFYVRQFVFDLAHSLQSVALTYSIKRTKVGDYKVEKS